MKDSDRDLIAALAEGSLSPDEAAALEARIAHDPEAQAELEAHRVALSALQSASRPQLTEAERTGLRRSLTEQLGLEPQPAPRRRFRVNWGAIAVAAAAVFAIVMISPLTSLLRTADDGTADTVVSAQETVEEAPAEADLDDFTLQQRNGASDEIAAATTAAPATTAAAAAEAPEASLAESEALDAPAFAGVPDAGEFDATSVDRLLGRLLESPEELQFFSIDGTVTDAALLPCGAEAGAAIPEIGADLAPLATLTLDGDEAVLWGRVADPAVDRYVVLLARADCSVLSTQTAPPGP